jgi:hypothetical protein
MAKRINEMEAQFIAGIKAGLSPKESAKKSGFPLKEFIRWKQNRFYRGIK